MRMPGHGQFRNQMDTMYVWLERLITIEVQEAIL